MDHYSLSKVTYCSCNKSRLKSLSYCLRLFLIKYLLENFISLLCSGIKSTITLYFVNKNSQIANVIRIKLNIHHLNYRKNKQSHVDI